MWPKMDFLYLLGLYVFWTTGFTIESPTVKLPVPLYYAIIAFLHFEWWSYPYTRTDYLLNTFNILECNNCGDFHYNIV